MRSLALTIILTGTLTLQADILHMRDGSRHYGELVSENDREVVFRVELPDGSGGAVRTFARSLVARVERTTQRSAATRPGDVTAAAGPDEDYEQMLREAFELLDDGMPHAALRAMQYVVLRAPAPVLGQLDEQCRAARGRALDELLAATRLHMAESGPGGRAFKLPYVTPYESAALGRMLQRVQEARLAREDDGRGVAEWADHAAEYKSVGPESRALVADAARAAAAISARLRLDPGLRGQRTERAHLVKLRGELARLAAHILALPGYTAPTDDTGGDDPAELAAARLAAEAAATSQPAREEASP